MLDPATPESTQLVQRTTSDLVFQMEIADYMKIKSKWQHVNNIWTENEPRGFYCGVQHCVPELDHTLQDQTIQPAIQQDRQLVPLLLYIRQFTHNVDELKHGAMATIETNMEFYLGYMKKDKLVNNYLKLFQSRVDTILVHGGAPGQHNGSHLEIFA